METATESNSFYQSDKRLAFLLLCLVTFLLLYTKKAFIESETAVFEFLQDRPEGGYLSIISTIQFITIPLIYLWKFTVIAFVIWIGCFMFGYKVTYSNCWAIALTSEFIFIVPEFIKIAWFTLVVTDPAYNEVRMFYPLSLSNFFNFEETSKQYIYPLKALNLFEPIYWLLLIHGVHDFAKKKLKVAAYIVFSSYVLLFFLWLGFYLIVYK